MFNKRLCNNETMIWQKGSRLVSLANARLMKDKQLRLNFSHGWLDCFKKRWKPKAFNMYVEGGDRDESAVLSKLSKQQEVISNFSTKNLFNCDGSAFFWQMALDRTIAKATFSGRKKQMSRFDFLLVFQYGLFAEISVLFIGTAMSPRCFKKKAPTYLGMCNTSNKNSWITATILSDCNQTFNVYIVKTPHLHVMFLLDNCSAHGTVESLLSILNISFHFLSPNTTSQLQPFNADVISTMKHWYRHRQREHTIDLMDISESETYNVDIFMGKKWLLCMWSER